MKITVRYGNRWFGNTTNTSAYALRIECPTPERLNLDFLFSQAAAGRGVGESQGYVSGAAVEFSREDARKIAVGILSALEQPTPTLLPLAFGAANRGLKDQLSADLTRADEPRRAYVLATFDGRTLQTMAGGGKALIVTGTPQHWAEASGAFAEQSWNRTALKKDKVRLLPWREHYENQVALLQADA